MAASVSAEGLDDGQEFWLQELRYLLACGAAPAVAAVRAGWPTAMAAERALERCGLLDLAFLVRRDRTWNWEREHLRSERASA